MWVHSHICLHCIRYIRLFHWDRYGIQIRVDRLIPDICRGCIYNKRCFRISRFHQNTRHIRCHLRCTIPPWDMVEVICLWSKLNPYCLPDCNKRSFVNRYNYLLWHCSSGRLGKRAFRLTIIRLCKYNNRVAKCNGVAGK